MLSLARVITALLEAQITFTAEALAVSVKRKTYLAAQEMT
jgi:hypothetical protein